MNILPKSIPEAVAKEHVHIYFRTLRHYYNEVKPLISAQPIDESFEGMYLCPICIKNYFIITNGCIIGNSEFSMDHLPPKSCGGTFTILTCKKCNNDSGFFESELERLLNFGIDKGNPNALFLPEVMIVDKKTGSSIKGFSRHENNKTDILFKEHLTKHNKSYIDFLSKMKAGELSLQLQVFSHNIEKVERALIKSAYLICFYWWGYEFVFSQQAKIMREVIFGTRRYPCVVPVNWRKENENDYSGISILQEGNERKCFLVSIRLQGKNIITTADVLVPSPEIDCWEQIASIDIAAREQETKEYSCITIPRIVDRLGYTVSWLQIIH